MLGMEPLTELGRSLRAARIRAGFGLQREAAIEAGMSRPLISQYERGHVEPSLSTAIRLADLYRCTLDELAGRTNGSAGT